MYNKKYIVRKTEHLESLGFKKTKEGYRKNIGSLNISVKNGLMKIRHEPSKVFYINSFEKLDKLVSVMMNEGMICNVLLE